MFYLKKGALVKYLFFALIVFKPDTFNMIITESASAHLMIKNVFND